MAEPLAPPARPSGMNTTARACTHRVPLRTTVIIAAAFSGTALLLAACSAGATSATSAGPGRVARSAPFAGAPAAPARARVTTQSASLLPASQAIIYTANLTLTVRAQNFTADTTRATSLVTAAGGYVASEQEARTLGDRGSAQVNLQLKIPVAQYAATLGQLTALGRQTALNQQAQDVTEQVADVSSRVTSAQAAIAQLRTLLSRAGSVGALLAVQDEINNQESALEALLAQQRALAHETSYATVSLLLVSHHVRIVKHEKKSGGFAGGLAAGWRALKLVVFGLLTALGAVLPFAIALALAGGIAYGGRRRLARRRTPPAAAPPPTAS